MLSSEEMTLSSKSSDDSSQGMQLILKYVKFVIEWSIVDDYFADDPDIEKEALNIERLCIYEEFDDPPKNILDNLEVFDHPLLGKGLRWCGNVDLEPGCLVVWYFGHIGLETKENPLPNNTQ